jgi:hypothetical protein
MNTNDRLQLNQMIASNNVLDQTNLIRELKHSVVLRQNVNDLILIKAQYEDDPDTFAIESMTQCNFLFTYYTDIYNKIKKDEIDIEILFKLIAVLEKIEDNSMDQHEASFEVGTILKEIYIDSALKKAKKLNALTELSEPEYKGPQVQMSWAEFKNARK